MGENMQTEIIKEGTTQIMVPVFKRGDYVPSKTPVFYNPKMELSRDISIACIAAFAGEQDSYVDALGATGIRGVRVANELCLNTTINDWDFKAYELIVKNIGLNKLDSKADRKMRTYCFLSHVLISSMLIRLAHQRLSWILPADQRTRCFA